MKRRPRASGCNPDKFGQKSKYRIVFDWFLTKRRAQSGAIEEKKYFDFCPDFVRFCPILSDFVRLPEVMI
jgi:hypothetical protein